MTSAFLDQLSQILTGRCAGLLTEPHLRTDIADLVQDALVRVIALFPGELPLTTEEESLAIGIGMQHIGAAARRLQRARRRSVPLQVDVPSHREVDPALAAEEADFSRYLARLVCTTLSDPQIQLLALRYYRDWLLREIASAFRESGNKSLGDINRVWRHLRLAQDLLRDRLKVNT